jgi:hypothetical protein
MLIRISATVNNREHFSCKRAFSIQWELLGNQQPASRSFVDAEQTAAVGLDGNRFYRFTPGIRG